eukprot:jgi/Mesvir1/13213/Mv06170-RA.1
MELTFRPRFIEGWLLLQLAVGCLFILLAKFLKRTPAEDPISPTPAKAGSKASPSITTATQRKSTAKAGADVDARKAIVETEVDTLVKTKLYKICRELTRKSFHILGGTLIVTTYHLGLKFGWCRPGYAFWKGDDHLLSFCLIFAPFMVTSWVFDFLRQVAPGFQRVFQAVGGPVLRESEKGRATGMSFFLPGAFMAAYLYPPTIAMVAVMFLTCGDAAAGLGTAWGSIAVPNTQRKVEGTIGCFIVCFILSLTVLQPEGDASFSTPMVYLSALAALWASLTELWAEVMGMDDNLAIPIIGGFGLQLIASQF